MTKYFIPTVLIILGLSLAVSHADEQAINFGGLIQGGFIYRVGDETLVCTEDTDSSFCQVKKVASDYEFTLDRAYLTVFGHIVSERIGYFGRFGASESEDGILDAKMSFRPVSYITINFGRFIPHITLFSARDPKELLFTSRPLMDELVYCDKDLECCPFASFGFAPIHTFRELGLEAHADWGYGEVYMGVFNGLDTKGWEDNNTAKDFYFAFNAIPIKGLVIKLSGLYAQPLEAAETDEQSEKDAIVWALIPGVEWNSSFGLLVASEYAYREYQPSITGEQIPDVVISNFVYGILGFGFHKLKLPLTLLAQVDYADFNTDNAVGHAGRKDELWRISGGLMYEIAGKSALLRADYYHYLENWEKIYDSDQNISDEPNRKDIKNDSLVFQVQLAF